MVTQMTSPSFPIVKWPHLTLGPENYFSQGIPPSWGSQVALAVKNQSANAGEVRDMGSVPGLGGSLGGGHDNSLQYYCLEIP